jgi:hypothetical protein
MGIGVFAAAKMAHLIDDKTVAKMGYPMVVVVRSSMGDPSGMTDKETGNSNSRFLRCAAE